MIDEKLCKKTFCKRHPKDAGLVESVYQCKLFLEDKPKWRTWETNASGQGEDNEPGKVPRPVGNKKAKQMAADRALVEKILLTGEKNKEESEERKKEEKNGLISDIRSSMAKVGDSMDVMVASK